VQLRFALPAEALQPFITTYYRTAVICSPREPWLEDWLHPEWANLRFLSAGEAQAAVGVGELRPCPAFAAGGPTSQAIRFRLRSGFSWGIGLLPLGWERLFAGAACNFADRFVDGAADPVFAAFAPLAGALAASDGDYVAEIALIESHMEEVFCHSGASRSGGSGAPCRAGRSRSADCRRSCRAAVHDGAHGRAVVASRLRFSAQALAAPSAVFAQPRPVHARSLAQVDRGARLPLS